MSGTDKQIVIEALGGGPVQIGAGGPAPAGNVTLPLETVVVAVNPAEPEEAPCCLVADVEVSREELADLYGLRMGSVGHSSQPEGTELVATIPMLLFIPLEGIPQQVVGDLSLDYIERAIAEVYRED